MDDLSYLHGQGPRCLLTQALAKSIGRARGIRKSRKAGSGHDSDGKQIVDLTQQGWHDYLINNYLPRLWDLGYRGFFLDGLENQNSSLTLIAGDFEEKALSNLIKRLHERFPVSLIFNRRFAILPEVGQYAVALAAESLFQRWEPSGQIYLKVIEPDHYWLLDKLRQARINMDYR